MGEHAQEDRKVFLVKAAILALAIRFFISAAYQNIFIKTLKSPLYAFDGEAYSIMGWYIALVLKGISLFPFPQAFIPSDYSAIAGLHGTIVKFASELPPIHGYGVGVYAYMMGLFYYVFGYAPALFRFLNSVINTALAFLVYLAARKNFNEGAARIAFVLSAFWPSAVIYSASLQRDTFVNFLIFFITYQILGFDKERKRPLDLFRYAAFFGAFALLCFLRLNAAYVLAAFIILYAYSNLVYSLRYLTIAATACLFAVSPVRDLIFGFLRSKMITMLNSHIYLTYLGGNVFRLLPEVYYKTEPIIAGQEITGIPFGHCLAGYIKGLAAFLFQPSPFIFYKIHNWVALPYMLLWYAVLLFAFIGVYFAMKNTTIKRVGLFIMLFLFTSAIGISGANVEALIRHRDMITPVYIIFAAYGLQRIGSRRPE